MKELRLDGLAALEARVAALEARVAVEIEPESVMEPYPGPGEVSAPRFVPTKPGWYWRLRNNDPIAAVVRRDGTHSPLRYLSPWNGTIDVTDDGRWLGPIVPYAPPPSERARAQMLAQAHGCFDYSGGYRSDPKLLAAFRHGIQTVINALSDPGSFQSRTLKAIAESPAHTEVGEPGETYLGNFVHELPKDEEP